MKTPVSYYGGKQRLVSKIIPLIPKHTVYCEPFVGGGAVFHEKPFPKTTSNDHYREVINDLDRQLINLYQNAHNPELIEKIQATPYSRVIHEQARQICKNPNSHSEIDRAWAYFVNINMSFGKIYNGGWRYGIKSQNDPPTWQNRLLRLVEWKEKIADVYIECDDAITVVQRWDGHQTFFYCDPPYPETRQDYQHKYTIEDLQKLVDCLANIKGSFILSNYHQDIKFPDHWEQFNFTARMSSANGRNRKNTERIEIVWRHINRDIPDWVQELYNTGKYNCFTGDIDNPIQGQLTLF